MNFLLLSTGIMLMMVAAVNCKRIRATLIDFKQWAVNGDREVVYPALLLSGGSLVIAVSWVLS